ncbi:APC family permease [Lysinibacillus sp. Bpr_S20]|uniref:APC family permease n=1 Tax=Lysinibacillus sp. Bpr_S20 TaxID=2933964 RepID=UPI0020124C22|nr:APC family permease [Lysinibacillus sp. Bpr_S20]MCL1699937.1 APC family permease [Lysinibacillus sp. Bpr_S20]
MQMIERTKLATSMKASWTWAIAFGSSIGWGAFILPSDWVSKAGSVAAMIGIILGALIMMLIAYCYGLLIEKFPVSGGGYSYAFYSAGRNWAFFTGWFMILGYASIIALNASAFSLLLKYLFPNFMNRIYLYTVAGWDVYLPEVIISTFIMLIFAVVNIVGSDVSGKVQLIFSVILALGVAIMAAFTFTFAEQPISYMQPFFKENQSMIISIIVILAIAPWAYVGFDNIPQTAEEFTFSAKKGRNLIVFSLISSALVYVLMIGVASWTVDLSTFQSNSQLWLIGSIIEATAGKLGVFILALAIIMGILTGLNGFTHSASRLLYSMARGKAVPDYFTKLHPTYKTPYRAIWFVVFAMLPAPWFGRPALSWIVDMSSIGVTIGYVFTCIAAYKVLLNEGGAILKKGIALLGLICSVGFILLLLVPNSPAALTVPSLLALIIWFLLGTVFFVVNYKRYKNISNEQLSYLILNIQKKDK